MVFPRPTVPLIDIHLDIISVSPRLRSRLHRSGMSELFVWINTARGMCNRSATEVPVQQACKFKVTTTRTDCRHVRHILVVFSSATDGATHHFCALESYEGCFRYLPYVTDHHRVWPGLRGVWPQPLSTCLGRCLPLQRTPRRPSTLLQITFITFDSPLDCRCRTRIFVLDQVLPFCGHQSVTRARRCQPCGLACRRLEIRHISRFKLHQRGSRRFHSVGTSEEELTYKAMLPGDL